MPWVVLAYGILVPVTLVGLYLVVVSARHLLPGRAGPEAALRLFGVSIPRTRLLLPLLAGAVLLAGSARFAATEARRRPQPAIVPAPSDFVIEPITGEPSYAGFHFLKDVRVIDLRSRIRVPAYRRDERVSPITWTRYSLIQKDSTAPDTLEFEFGTTGVDVAPRSLTHRYLLAESSEPHRHGERTLTSTWRVRVDVTEEQVGQPFLVITEATYWNGFRDEEREWAAMVAEGSGEIGIIVLFPEDKPFHDPELRACEHQATDCPAIRDAHIAIPSPNRRVHVWRVPNARPGWQYEARWSW